MLSTLNSLELAKKNMKKVLRRKLYTDCASGSLHSGKRVIRRTGLIIGPKSFDESNYVLPQYVTKIHEAVQKATFADLHTLVLCCEDREAALKAACYFGLYKKDYETKREAGLVAEILAEVGVGSGAFVKAGRREVVGKYVGHTAPKVAGLFDETRGGVLFIGEAGFLTLTLSGGFV